MLHTVYVLLGILNFLQPKIYVNCHLKKKNIIMSKLDPIKKGSFWCQFLVVTLVNVCIVSLAVGLTWVYVQKDQRSFREEVSDFVVQSLGKLNITDALATSVSSGNPTSVTAPPIIKPPSGDTYVRWGRTTCPNGINTEFVYAGFAAGAFYNTGGSSDFLCLPSDPHWSNTYDDRVNSLSSHFYGMEYELDFDPFSHQNAEVLHDHDVPCAVCRLLDRGTKLLFPAKLGCPPKWTEEYRGFLMSAHNGHGRAEAVCVDQAPEVIIGSQSNQNGALIHLADGICGSLPCPPYVNGREITCTVCSI